MNPRPPARWNGTSRQDNGGSGRGDEWPAARAGMAPVAYQSSRSWSGSLRQGRSAIDDPVRRTLASKRVLAARFWRCASGFWRAPTATAAWLLTAVLIGAAVLELTVQFRLNYWSRDFFDAFDRRDATMLRQEALLFLLLAGSSVLVAILSIWARMTTQRRWRAWLTQHLIDRWLADGRFRRLRFIADEDANPEYRIAEDVRVATDGPVSMASGVLSALLSGIVFISILWKVGGDLVVDVQGYALTVPKYLVLAVAAYSALLTLAIMLIGRRMTHVIAGKNAAEAQFRSVASTLRNPVNRPTNDAASQHRSLREAFETVTGRWRALCTQLMRTALVSHGNTLAAPVIAWVLCAPKYLAGSMSLGEVAQAVSAFVMVQAALNWLVDNYPGLAECLSSVNRVAALLFALDELDDERPSTHRRPFSRAGGPDDPSPALAAAGRVSTCGGFAATCAFRQSADGGQYWD